MTMTTTAQRPPAGRTPASATRRDEPGWIADVTVGAVEPAEYTSAAALLARGMRDNPLHVAAFGDDPGRREQRLWRFFDAMLSVLRPPLLGARRADGTLVGVCGIPQPGTSEPTPSQLLRFLVRIPVGLPSTLRALSWVGAWSKLSPKQPHWHVGPLAVDAGLQGLGIGSLIMAHYCARADEDGRIAYLETDKAVNVTFYQRFGFEVVGDQTVLGVSNWFMRRPEAIGSRRTAISAT